MSDQTSRLLIVSPHFPPSNTADSQRVRMLLPFFTELGWEPTVLAVNPDQVASPRDAWLEQGLPDDVEIIRVQALGLGWSWLPGLGTLDYRAVGALRHAGNALLSNRKFELVYFSTTVFSVHVLGPYWKSKFGIPFVMDFQDPWVSDYYKKHKEIHPPGGRIKYSLSQWLARKQERRVLNDCAGITAVSTKYPNQLYKRYSSLKKLPALVLPFPGSRRDMERIKQQPVIDTGISFSSNYINWLYIGRGGQDMKRAVSALFLALENWRRIDPVIAGKVRLYFIGTSYAAPGQGEESILPVAATYNMQKQVVEQTDRIPYSIMLTLLKQADALIVPGSNDSAYTASKIYPYLLAQKPLLAIFHEESSVVDLIKKAGGGAVVSFTNDDGIETIAERICTDWLYSGQYQQPLLNNEVFEPYTDHGSAKQLCGFLHRVMNDR